MIKVDTILCLLTATDLGTYTKQINLVVFIEKKINCEITNLHCGKLVWRKRKLQEYDQTEVEQAHQDYQMLNMEAAERLFPWGLPMGPF